MFRDVRSGLTVMKRSVMDFWRRVVSLVMRLSVRGWERVLTLFCGC